MSRTHKDKPYRLGGDRHRWYCCDNHGSHGKFTRLMSRLARRDLNRSFLDDPDSAVSKSRREYEYFD